MGRTRRVWGDGRSWGEIHSPTPMPTSLSSLSDLDRGVLIGEGREAMAREKKVVCRLNIGRWQVVIASRGSGE